MKTKKRTVRGGKPHHTKKEKGKNKGKGKEKGKDKGKGKSNGKKQKRGKNKTPRMKTIQLSDILRTFLSGNKMKRPSYTQRKNMLSELPEMKCTNCGHCSKMSKFKKKTPRMMSFSTGKSIACQKINNGPMICRQVEY